MRLRRAQLTSICLLAALVAAIAVFTIVETQEAHSQAPEPPGGLAATVRGGYVALRWSPSTGAVDVAGYNVWRRNNPGSNWSLIAETRSLGYLDTAVVAGKGYAYGVRAYSAARNASGPSSIVTVQMPSVKAHATGLVLWAGDAERPLNKEWAQYGTATHCGVVSNEVTSDPQVFRESSVVAQGSNAYEFVIKNGDNCYGARAELGQAVPDRTDLSVSRLFHQGDDRWFSFQVRLGGDFPVHTPYWDVIAQWKQLAATSSVPYPMVALQVYSGAYYLEHAIGTATSGSTTVGRRLANAITKQWVKISVHIKFSTDPTVGFVEVYGDPNGRGMRLLMPLTHFATLATDASGNPLPSHSRIGIYRDSTIRRTAHLYLDGYTVATTRSAAEANAFAPFKAVNRRRLPH